MFVGWKLKGIVLASLVAALASVPTDAGAISVDVAKKCNLLLAKAFPPRQPGNPAAGSAKGNGQASRDYFNKCVANGGNMDDASDKNSTDKKPNDQKPNDQNPKQKN
jgi:hypothetical protein